MIRAVLGILLIGWATASPALERQRADTYHLPEGERLDAQLWLSANEARLDGSIADDLFALAQTLRMRGAAANDVWLLANTMEITGTVGDHARLAGGTIVFGGVSSNSLAALGSAVQLTTGSVVRAGVYAAGQSVTLEGLVEGDTRIFSDQATLAGTCKGSVRIFANDIVVMPGASIEGDLVYTAPKELVLDPRVRVAGRVLREPLKQAPGLTGTQRAVIELFSLLTSVVSGLALVVLFPRGMSATTAVLRDSPLRCGWIGILAFCGIPLFAMLALVTLIGVPLAILLATAFGILLYVSKIVVAVAIGARWMGGATGRGRMALALLPGLFLLHVASWWPALGSVVWFLTSFLGIGAIGSALAGRPALADPPPPPTN